MTTLPIQNRLPREIYPLLEKQVKSYHRHYRMGENSSVPLETAQELLESVLYTLRQSPAATLEAGQSVLEEKLGRAKELCHLVRGTVPDWESQYRWETAAVLERFLEGYDHLHFAHRVPDAPDYPLLLPIPEQVQGIDHVLAFLNCLWLENQILDALGSAARGSWEQRIPDYWGIPLNLCEQPLIQLLGRQLLQLPLSASELTDAHRRDLLPLLESASAESLRSGMEQLCSQLGITHPHAVAYACVVIDSLFPRLTAALPTGNLSYIFL